jgi:hypothetical protein
MDGVCLQVLKLLELGDGEGDVSIQQVPRQIPAETRKNRDQLKKMLIYSKKVVT